MTNVCFSPNGRYVLAFNLDSCVRLWDYVAQPSIVKKTYQGHRNKAFSIGGCFGVLESGSSPANGSSPDDHQEDETNVQPQQPQPQPPPPPQPPPHSRCSRSHSRSHSHRRLRPFVAAASEDGDVVLWDVGTKAVVQRLRRAHKGGVCFWVDVCGATMVSCGQDGWINVYQHKEAGGEEAGGEEAEEAEEAVEVDGGENDADGAAQAAKANGDGDVEAGAGPQKESRHETDA